MWKECNDVVFNDIIWFPTKLLQFVWLGIMDYGHLECFKVCHARKDHDAFGVKITNILKTGCEAKTCWYLWLMDTCNGSSLVPS